MTAQKIVNWEAIFDQLRRAGITSYTLEKELSIPRTTLLQYANLGARPKYDEGERLLKYWRELTNSSIEQIPYTAAHPNGNRLHR